MSYPPHQRKARTRGIPVLGAGAIFPVDEEEVKVRPFEIPKYWPKAYGFDVGWNRTAAVFGAHDRESGILYLYSEYYRAEAEPPIHATAVKTRAGNWMPGAIDPAARGRGQKDGERLIDLYEDNGLLLYDAENAVEAGLLRTWEWLSTGRLKVFDSLQSWLFEFRIYRRDEKGKVIKQHDHLMDATRYLMMTGMDLMTVPVARNIKTTLDEGRPQGWLGN